MNTITKIFNNKKCIATNSQRGSVLVELLLSVALAAIIIPFIFQYQMDAARRAENIAVTRQMDTIQSALERYIVDNREQLLIAIGNNITRIELKDLLPYGIPETFMDAADKYQLRILKSSDLSGHSTLQGVIVLDSSDITPMRTREIVSLGGDSMGFIDGNRAYGSFGAWHSDTLDLGLNAASGIVETTAVNRDSALYLWRLPSTNTADATMMSPLNLGGHDIKNATFFNSMSALFNETLVLNITVAKDIIFQNRTTIDKTFESQIATVSGALSADSRNMEVLGAFNLADSAKFSSFTTGDLWVTNLTLSGLSVYTDGGPSVLKVNKSVDMTSGRVDAMFATVGFAGSITPRLVVHNRIEDSTNSSYFWDTSYNIANFVDMSLLELWRLAPLSVYNEKGANTISGKTFGAVAANKNATVSDYINAINEIQVKVRAKYRQLNLQ